MSLFRIFLVLVISFIATFSEACPIRLREDIVVKTKDSSSVTVKVDQRRGFLHRFPRIRVETGLGQ